MLNFKVPELSDKQWADNCLKHAASMNCDYTFGNCYLWRLAYNTEICKYKNFFICRWGNGDDITYSLPLGEGDFTDAIYAMVENAKECGHKLKIYGVTEGYWGMLQEAFTGKFDYTYDPGNFDYIYSVQKMASLSGKKYHSKRNHITNFKKNHPDWSFETINKDNISQCLEAHAKWIASKDPEDEEDISEYSLEFEAVAEAFENYDALDLKGGLIKAGDEVIAFTLGEVQASGKCFVTHFEKAPGDVQGAFAIINQEFTKNCLMDYEYVNREEDLNIEGLRKAKQSYYPEILLEKCLAVYHG